MTQEQQVLTHLLKFGKISSWEAIQTYGITRLSQYIYLLKKKGYQFRSENKTVKKENGNSCTFTIYHLEDEEKEIRKCKK